VKTVFKSSSGSKKDALRDQLLTIAAGSLVYSQGDLGTEMFIILEGEVHLVKTLRGEPVVISRLEKGDFFGEMAVIESAARTTDALAHVETSLLPITAARFDEMLRKNPEIALRMIRKYAIRLQEANELLERLAAAEVDPDDSLRRLAAAAAAASAGPLPDQHTSSSVEPAAAPKKSAKLVDTATGRSFCFGRNAETTIGRTDPVTGILPDIDLTPVDVDRSVSRRHAKILKREGRFSILEEVGTINGTFVNDERIPTGQPIPLKDGDRVRVGLIQMRVVFD
jgi:CRP-like cAMP-binding protein